MKKRLTNKFSLEITPYNCHLLVLYKPTLAMITEYRVMMGFEKPSPDYLETVRGEVLWDRGRGVLFLGLDVTDVKFGSVLAHECGHIALNVFDFIGEKHQPTGNMHEPFCYLLSHTYQRIWEACLKIDVSNE